MAEQQRESFGEWVLLELMGHRRLAGYLTEQELAGQGFLRLEIPGETRYDAKGEEHGSGGATQYYSPSAVYAIHPIAEDLARQLATKMRPEPVTRWDLPALPAPQDNPAENLGFGVTDNLDDDDIADDEDPL